MEEGVLIRVLEAPHGQLANMKQVINTLDKRNKIASHKYLRQKIKFDEPARSHLQNPVDLQACDSYFQII